MEIERSSEDERGRVELTVVAFQVGEPDASLFRPPASFEIVCPVDLERGK